MPSRDSIREPFGQKDIVLILIFIVGLIIGPLFYGSINYMNCTSYLSKCLYICDGSVGNYTCYMNSNYVIHSESNSLCIQRCLERF